MGYNLFEAKLKYLNFWGKEWVVWRGASGQEIDWGIRLSGARGGASRVSKKNILTFL